MVLLKARSREWIMTEDKFIKARELMDAIGFLERKLKELKNHNIVDVKSLLPQEWESFIGTALAIDTWLVLKDNFVKKLTIHPYLIN